MSDQMTPSDCSDPADRVCLPWRSPDVTGREHAFSGDRPALSVGILLADNFTLSAFSLFVDQLRLAGDEGDLSRPIRCQWSVMAASAEPIRASCGVAVQRTSTFVDPRQFDYVAVVGGLLHAGRQMDSASTAYLQRSAAAGVPLIGLCTGSFILVRAGLMDGRLCCVSWYHHQDFLDEFPGQQRPVADRMFVVDGDRITCSGGSGVADLATWLIDRRLGRAAAQKARHVMLLDRPRLGDDSQPHPPVADGANGMIDDMRVRRALLIMEQHLAEPIPIREIAIRLQLSVRQLERLFRSIVGLRPALFYRSLRLRHARWLLDHTSRTVTDIALDTGFADGAHFSRQFKAMAGVSPSAARSQARLAGSVKAGVAASRQLVGARLFE